MFILSSITNHDMVGQSVSGSGRYGSLVQFNVNKTDAQNRFNRLRTRTKQV